MYMTQQVNVMKVLLQTEAKEQSINYIWQISLLFLN
jgi:hypothetical protein